MSQNSIGDLNDNVLNNLKGLISADTIIGDPITTPDGTLIIPVSKVSFGFAAGGADIGKDLGKDKFGGGTGGGVTIQPIAFLIVKDGHVQTVQLAEEGNTANRALNMVPEVVTQITELFNKKKKDTASTAPATEEA